MIRIGLFLATNLALPFILNFIITGLSLHQPGTNRMPMLIMAGIFGMAGSFYLSSVVNDYGQTFIRSPGYRIPK